MTATLSDYNKLLADEPTKFSEDDASYRESDDRLRCGRCLHFYERKLDRRGICEVVRPDDEDTGIEADMVCKFFSHDGDTFPLLEGDDDDND